MTAAFVCPDDHAHGDKTTCRISHGCRCTPCMLRAATDNARRRRLAAYGLDNKTTRPAIGVRRRMQALAALGWSVDELAAMAGISPRTADHWTMGAGARVFKRTFDRVDALYERLWNTPPTPTEPIGRRRRTMALARAAEHNWVLPLAWDDIDTDETPPIPDEAPIDEVDHARVALAIDGIRLELTRAERLLVVEQLNAWAYPDGAIAEQLGCAIRTIERDREVLGLPAAVGADKQPIGRAA